MRGEFGENANSEETGPHRRRPLLGITENFHPGDHQSVEQVLCSLSETGVTQLRTAVDLLDFAHPQSREWYAWLFPRIARDLPIVPCLDLFSASHWREQPESLVELINYFIIRHGKEFEWLEFWCSSPVGDHLSIQDDVIRLAKKLGKKVAVPASLSDVMNEAAFEDIRLPQADAIVLRLGIRRTAESLDGVLHQIRSGPDRQLREVWIIETEDDRPTDGMEQVANFCLLMSSGADRVFWPRVRDAEPGHAGYRPMPLSGPGLCQSDGKPKLLGRILTNHGPEGVSALHRVVGRHTPVSKERYILITGGAGFVGTNLADRLAREGNRVMVFDNLGRAGVEENLQWLCARHGERIAVKIADIRDSHSLKSAVAQALQVYHLAAQVAVTTSLVNPTEDFAVNAGGTLQLLDSLRALADPPPLVFTSTNKVYGKLSDLPLVAGEKSYYPADIQLRAAGINEERPLDFYSPYGCSKGTADQYVRDFSRMYGLPAVVFRMSCIYGPHQYGTEDQGWVAHFLIRALRGEAITLFGDGKQVRDILYIDDLVEALLAAMAHMDEIRGRIFNIGGGPANALSLLEFLALIERMNGSASSVGFGPWRPGDQAYYVSDTTAFRACTGWQPRIGTEDGIAALNQWLRQMRSVPIGHHQRGWAFS